MNDGAAEFMPAGGGPDNTHISVIGSDMQHLLPTQDFTIEMWTKWVAGGSDWVRPLRVLSASRHAHMREENDRDRTLAVISTTKPIISDTKSIILQAPHSNLPLRSLAATAAVLRAGALVPCADRFLGTFY